MGIYVQYVAFPGLVTRQISKKDWKDQQGVEFEDVVFNSANRNTVDASKFPAEVLEYFRSDPAFKVVEADTAPKPPKQVTGAEYEALMEKTNEGLNDDEPKSAKKKP